MKLVVDTNVVAYFLLGTPKFVDETRAFWSAADQLIAPSIWESEIANVVWMSARAGVIREQDASAKLSLAGRLGIQTLGARALWHGALARSLATGVAVYDTLFVELADREDTRLVTFDEKVLKAFPGVAKRPRDIARG